MNASRVILLSLTVGVLASARALPQEKRALAPEDLVDFRGVEDVWISPDGRAVAFVVTEPVDPKKKEKPETPRDTNIWVVPADGSRTARSFVTSPKNGTRPRWSPDGRYIVGFEERAHQIDLLTRILAWYDKYLKD